MKDKIARVDVETLQNVLYRELKGGITCGRFAPGEALTIRSIAAAAGTSVMPVREALQKLVAEGAVESRANRTFAIPIPSRSSVDELYRVRKVLEGIAVGEACDRSSPALVSSLLQETKAMKAAAKAEDYEAYLEANHRFHFALYSAADTHHLIAIIESLWLKSGPLLRAFGKPEMDQDRKRLLSQEPHLEIIEGIRLKDRLRAMRGIELDLELPASWFRKHYESMRWR